MTGVATWQSSRRVFLDLGPRRRGWVFAVAAARAGAGDLTAAGDAPRSPSEALTELQAGNRRFTAGQLKNHSKTSVRRAELVESQAPFAIVLGCADSRVSPEIVFDQGLGSLFTIRVAGNTGSDPLVIGSAEYAASILKSSLLVVLGHDGCGAVKAAIDVVTKGTSVPGELPAVVEPIIPAVEAVQTVPAHQLLDAAIEANVHRTVTTLRTVPSLASAIDANQLKIVGAHYRLDTGQVSFESL